MMTITTGGELRQLGLLGIQMGAVDRFIIEVFPSLPPLRNTFLLLQDGRCQGVIVTVVFSGFLFFFFFDKSAPAPAGVSRRCFTTQKETNDAD